MHGRVPDRPTLTDRTVAAGHAALEGRSLGVRAFLPFAGPAVIASVAYMDPGNFATNIEAGAKYNYDLLWVVLLANLIAMLFQALSAKLGMVTGRNLAELCRTHFPQPAVWAMWIVAEVAAMATDLAEFLGGAIGLSLLFHLPLIASMVATGVITYAILLLQRTGFRPLELLIGAFVGIIGLAYLVELAVAPPHWGAVAFHAVVPHLADGYALTLSIGIIGATVMPHAIYLHSSLTQNRVVPRDEAERRKLILFSNREVLLALGFAGLVNMAMVCMAAAAFHQANADVATIETAYRTLIPLLGWGAAGVFLVALIASGLSSSAVGTLAGQVVMQGFVGISIPISVRRLVTMAPAFVVVGFGVDATQALVLSQVVLSLALPVPMVTLLLLSGRADVMGAYVNSNLTARLAILAAVIVLALNLLLVLQVLGIAIPFLSA
ncbi:MAG TPA: Nramp family divalent metal transporter [Stellaceae bacterium]|nr:Nramp family divalent metal transporter [Stellaceae bacterium]